jgi:hypothetical protein
MPFYVLPFGKKLYAATRQNVFLQRHKKASQFSELQRPREFRSPSPDNTVKKVERFAELAINAFVIQS